MEPPGAPLQLELTRHQVLPGGRRKRGGGCTQDQAAGTSTGFAEGAVAEVLLPTPWVCKGLAG